MIGCDEFLEYAEYVGEFYGTPKKQIYEAIDNGRDILLEIEVQGARQVMAIFPNAVTIYIIPPSIEELERRLRGRRTESEDKLAARLKRACEEIEEKIFYDHIVVNDDLSHAVEEIFAIIGRV